ncbi:PEP/pyruvate-binding domain-containing protein [Desulfopila sp. IMCC35008]|uniref:PEP/pyruvate-binding domain-containing protein n=1 Tax=Desulfopila sp. IMCC35008 TaxID=2653858 RepID=UPI0013D169B1|nr:PEP/pyruvate-binding domain-containing protein [Desulfopila sp. IMCC35008]
MAINSLVKHWSYRIIAPGTLLREQYESLRSLLHYDVLCHEQMAQLQALTTTGKVKDFAGVRKDFADFSANVAGMVDALQAMVPGKYSPLTSYHKKFDFYCRFLLAPPKTDFQPPYTIPLQDISRETRNCGNKARQLACLNNDLDISVPPGFAITADGYHYLVAHNNLRDKIDRELATLDIMDLVSLTGTSTILKQLIREAVIPPELANEILSSHDTLFGSGNATRLAVRSNATCEDGENSFAGQFITKLNVKRDRILEAYKKVLASKYSPEALFYRIRQGWGDEETAMSVLILEMVPACWSGVIYTADTQVDKNSEPLMQIHAVNGLGEKLVSGAAKPETYTATRKPPYTILSGPFDQLSPKQETVHDLASYAMRLERYFGYPLDIEWAVGPDDKAFILQARPLHLELEKTERTAVIFDNPVLCTEGVQGSAGAGSGPIFRLDEDVRLDAIPAGSILLTRNTPPSYVQVMDKLSGVISESGSRASHFATVAREFGIPFICGVPEAMELFSHGMVVTVDSTNGVVYEGRVEPLLEKSSSYPGGEKYHRILTEALKFITPLELIDPAGDNFIPEGCRSMHDIIRFCHENALLSLFTSGRPGSGRGSRRLEANIPLDVYLFDVGGGISENSGQDSKVPLTRISSPPFQSLWRGLSHPDVAWKQKPFDWAAYDKIELAGGVPPKKDSFSFASYAVIGAEYLHFHLRFGYHFTIVDVMCGPNEAENHCLLRFAGGGADFDQRSLRIDFLEQVLARLGFSVETKGDLLEAKMLAVSRTVMDNKLDILGRLLGATKLMDMVLDDQQKVAACVDDFFRGRYSFSEQG